MDPNPDDPVCPLICIKHDDPETLKELTKEEKLMVIDSSDNRTDSPHFNQELRNRIIQALEGT